MTTGRIDFYTKVHKALRANLFEVSRQAALADYGDPQAVSALAASVKALLAKLSAHAGHESRFIHPLIAEKTGACSFEAEHEVLEDEQMVLAGLLDAAAQSSQAERRLRGLAFYRALNLFIARYLEHLDREEATMPVLWARCSDEELAAVMARFGASRPLDEALGDIGWMLPSLNAEEQRELIGGVSAALRRPT